jgi:hypothetical protein
MMTKSALLLVTLSTLSVGLVSAVKPALETLHAYTFEQYVRDFDLGLVTGSAEYTTRENIFVRELDRVVAHNAAGKSWKETINRFSTMTSAELKVCFCCHLYIMVWTLCYLLQAYKGRSKGVAKNHVPIYQKELPRDFVMKPVWKLPTDVDWRSSDVVTPVKDQGSCG